MGIFDIFNKKPQKSKYQVYCGSISAVLNLLERKKSLVENLEIRNSILDFDFDKRMIEKMMLIDLIKSGSISFLGDECKYRLN